MLTSNGIKQDPVKWYELSGELLANIVILKPRKVTYYFSFLFQPSINFMRKNVTEIVGTMDSNLVMSLFKMIDCFLAPFIPKEVNSSSI